ncbi:hypothetical protein BGZ93_009512 [Podila epicladia]|nr:hypothetical protein BGZ92_006846 [Podila epicladia]KAG0099010.1 hypothetical protein BGZ93_009512 [Podila epicladia]
MDNNSTSQSPIPVQLRSLSLFFLPKDLIASLELPNSLITASATPTELTQVQEILPPITAHGSNLDTIATSSSSTSTITPSCRVCGIVRLDSVEQQREHVKSEWHRYNLKQQILYKGSQPIQEQHFKRLASQLSLNQQKEGTEKGHKPQKHTKRSSRRNSDNSVSGVEISGKDDLMQCLLRDLEITLQENERLRLKDPMRVAQEQALELQRQKVRMSPLIWFTTSLYGTTVRLGVYKNSLVNKGQCEDLKAYLDSVQIAVAPIPPKNIKLKRAARAKLLEQQQQQQQLEPGKPHMDVPEASEQQKPMDKAPEQPLSLPLDLSIRPRHWTMLLLGGGHFAGMVIDLTGQVKRYSRVREMKIEAHKTFHRYTVRRKNGGAQSSFGAANSAGAMVRMYNETALKLEVRGLLEKWSEWIQKSEMVFIHAPGNNRRTVIYDGSIIAAAEKEGRLRSIPFVTRRPTLTELKRCYSELTVVKVSTLPQEELEALEQAEAEALQKVTEEQSQGKEIDDEEEDEGEDGDEEEEEEEEDTHVVEPPKNALSLTETLKLVELVRKGRADAVSTHLLRYGANPSHLLPDFPPKKEYDFHRTPTLLHLAAHHGRAEVVKVLLEKHLADPTVTSHALQSQGKDIAASLLTAYEVAKDKETRNAFRRAMARMPDQWEWHLLAHVPAPLTSEMERRAKEKSRKQLAGEKERKKTRKQSESLGSPMSFDIMLDTDVTFAIKSRSGSPVQSASESGSDARSERECRANAAEARIRAQRQLRQQQEQQQHQQQRPPSKLCCACGDALDRENGLPFEKFGRQFCSMRCVVNDIKGHQLEQ